MSNKSITKSRKPRTKLSAGTEKMPSLHDPFWWSDDINGMRRSERATPKTIQKIATAYACVDVYGKTMGMLPGSVFKKKAGGGKDVVVRHPLYSVLRKPNELMDRVQFWQLKERTQILYGNFYAQKIFNQIGELIALHPIHPDIVTVKQVERNNKKIFDIEYIIKTDQGDKVISREDMFHTKEPGEDGLVGRSRVQIVAGSFEMALSLLAQNQSISDNDSRPLGLLSPEGSIRSDADKNNLKASWEEAHKGPRRAGRVAVVPFGVKYTQLSMSARDAQLIEMLVYFGVDSVNTIFDVPPYRTQDFRRATFSNVEQADLFWAKNSVAPRVVATEAAIEAQLLSEAEREKLFVKFNIDAIFRADIKTRHEAYRYAIQDGWLNRAEIREIEDWDPADSEHGLDEFLAPSNMMTARAMKKAGEAPPEPSKKDEKPEAEPEKDTKSEQEALSALLKEPLKRLILKEKRAILKCLKKENWEKESTEFYEKHKKHMHESLLSSFSAWFSAGYGENLEGIDMDKAVDKAILAHITYRANIAAEMLEVDGVKGVSINAETWDLDWKIAEGIELIVKELLNYER